MEKIEKTDEFREIICKECGKPFYIDIHSMARPRYCSDECKKANAERYYREYCMKKRNAAVNDLGENAVEGVDYVECPICHERRSLLTMTHFKRHGYTSKELLFKDYPNLLMTRKKLVNEHLVGLNNPMSKTNRNELERKLASPYSIEHYLKKYDGDEVLAKLKLDEFLSSLDRSTWMENTRIEYYLAKGMTLEEAENTLKERQNTTSLESYIKRYGAELGTEKYLERNKRWKESLFENFVINGDGRSKQSKFTSKLILLICENLNIEYPKKEKYISDNTCTFAYDFCYNHKIIEFNGDYWHCNPMLYESNYYNKNKLMTAELIWQYDKNKIEVAKKHGYDVLTIWECDYNNDFLNTLKKCIDFVNNE